MTRIFEIKTTCPAKSTGTPPVSSTYRVSALDGEKAIAKAKKNKHWNVGPEKVLSVVLLAETD
jgi:hypothetical protein